MSGQSNGAIDVRLMRILRILFSEFSVTRAAAIWAVAISLLAAPVQAQETLISAARCEQNRAAGPITFLTSFAYAATVGLLDVVAADELGTFKSLCLEVKIQPGLDNIQLTSAGRAQIAGLGNPSVAMTGFANGAGIIGIASYGNVPAIELITMQDGPIRTLKDLEGHTLGYKAAIVPQISVMLLKAGVDLAKVRMVSVGYDPTILTNATVDALVAYKSNEPRMLESKGFKVKEWDPVAYGVQAAFNTQIANRDFAKAHPTAVEDFLRASFRAYAWINASETNLDKALGFAQRRSTAGYDLALSKLRWKTEVALVNASQPAGKPLGWQSAAQWQPEAEALVEYKLVKSPPDPAAAQTPAFVDAITRNGALVWPAP